MRTEAAADIAELAFLLKYLERSLRLRPGSWLPIDILGHLDNARQITGSSALVGRLFRSHDHEIAHRALPVDGKIRHGDVTDWIAAVRAVDGVHNPTPNLRRTK